jgi:uncharacterized protein YcnI
MSSALSSVPSLDTSCTTGPSTSGSPRGLRGVRRWGRRVAVLGVLTGTALLGVAGTAFAHVEVDPPAAAQGGSTKVAFRTPNEEADAATVKLEVSFPTDHPVPSVLTEPIPGWTATVEKTNLTTPIQTSDAKVTQAVSKITWSGGQIAPGQFADFTVDLESLPSDTDKLVFKAVQTYSNGDVVRWIDDSPAGGPEPEHPAPTLTLTKAASATDAAGAGAPPVANTTATGAGSSTGTAALTLGIIGTILGLLGAVLGGLALRRRGTTGAGTGSG